MQFTFVWNIENYNFRPPLRGKALKSPCFNVNLLGSTFLELYPRGDILDSDGESIIVCLGNCKKIPYTSVVCDLSIEQGDLKIELKSEKIYDYAKWKFRKEKDPYKVFGAERDDLEFVKTTLTVKCHFSQLLDMGSKKELLNHSDTELFSRDLENAYTSQLFSDLTLCCGDQKFPIHKAILYARLPKFASDLEIDLRPNVEITSKEVTTMEPSVLQFLLKYAYCGKLATSILDIPSELYTVADTLNLTDLKRKLFFYPNMVTARTCVKVDQHYFVWPLKDFQKMELRKNYFSPSFTGGVIPSSDLKFVCYLSLNSSGILTLEICVRRLFVDKDNPIFVKCKLTISGYSRSAEHLFASDEEWHFPSFLPMEYSFDEYRIVGPHNNTTPAELLIKCKFCISGPELSEIEETDCSASKYENFSNCSSDVRSLCTDIGQLYNIFLPKISDVTLLIGDVRFPAHKGILAARSPVFCRMFDNDMLEKNSGIVKITDIDVSILNIMLTYIYSAYLGILNYDSAVKLYSAADKYEVTSLKERCMIELKSFLNVENVCDLLVLADMHSDAEFKDFAKNFILAHPDVVLQTPEWKNLLETRVDLVSDILHSLAIIIQTHTKACAFCSES